MSKVSKRGLSRAAGAAAIAAVAAVGMSSMGAGNAAAGPLPDGYKNAVGIDGESIETWRQGEAAFPVPSQANNGAGRAAEVSGVFTSQASEGVSGALQVGYLVGCQVDITGFSGGISGSLGLTPSISGSLTVPLKPGEVTFVNVDRKSIKPGSAASVQLSRVQLDVQQCGGYASARSVAVTTGGKGYKVDGDTNAIVGEGSLIKSTLYGAPFSLN